MQLSIYSLESILRKRYLGELNETTKKDFSAWLVSCFMDSRRTVLAMEKWAQDDHEQLRLQVGLFRILLNATMELRGALGHENWEQLCKILLDFALSLVKGADQLDDPMLSASLSKATDYKKVINNYPLTVVSLLAGLCDPTEIFTAAEWEKLTTDKKEPGEQS